jgi:hypothetical protein
MAEPPQDDPSEVRLVDRKLTDAETDAIRALVTSFLRQESVRAPLEEDDISDIAAYCSAMLSNEKTIAYVVEELAVFFADTDPSLGPDLGRQLQQYLVEQVLAPPEQKPMRSSGNALTLSGALEASRESKSRHKQAFERLTAASEGRGADQRRGRGDARGRRGGRSDVRGGRGEPRGGRRDFGRGDSHRSGRERARGGRGSEYPDHHRGERHEQGERGEYRPEDRPRGERGRGEEVEGRGKPRFEDREGRPSTLSGQRRARDDAFDEARPTGRTADRGEWSRTERATSGRGELRSGRGDVPRENRMGERGGRRGERGGGRGDRPGRLVGGRIAAPSESAPESKRMRRPTEEDQYREEEEYQNHHHQPPAFEGGGYEESGGYDEYHQSDGYDGGHYDEHYYPSYAPRGRGRGRSFYRGGRGRFSSADPAPSHPSPIVAAGYRGGRGGRAHVVKSMIASKTWVRNKPDAAEAAAPGNEGAGE